MKKLKESFVNIQNMVRMGIGVRMFFCVNFRREEGKYWGGQKVETVLLRRFLMWLGS